jgi:hypothetical protein
MIDYYLKFENEAEAQEKLTGYTGSIDVIGILHETVATSDPDKFALAGTSMSVVLPLSSSSRSLYKLQRLPVCGLKGILWLLH